jgi:hypothetical protein
VSQIPDPKGNPYARKGNWKNSSIFPIPCLEEGRKEGAGEEQRKKIGTREMSRKLDFLNF